LSDRLCRNAPQRKIALAVVYCLLTCVLLSAGFRLEPGPLQLTVIAIGMFVAMGTSGPSGAMVANLTHVAVHGAAFATLTLANNLLGLAPGPYLTGVLADHLGLLGALRLIPLVSLAAAAVFAFAHNRYLADVARLDAGGGASLLRRAGRRQTAQEFS
jgi:hypothetical protein